MALVLFLLVWIGCAVLAFGIAYGYFQAEYPEFAWKNRRKEAGFCALLSLALGPAALIASIFSSGFVQHGLRYRPIDEETSWAAFHDRYPSLSRKDFLR